MGDFTGILNKHIFRKITKVFENRLFSPSLGESLRLFWSLKRKYNFCLCAYCLCSLILSRHHRRDIKMLRKNVNVTLVDYLYQGFYALNTLYGTCVTWEFWFTNEISKRRWEKCITNRAEWTSSSVLHCNVTVAAWWRENTCDVGAAL